MATVLVVDDSSIDRQLVGGLLNSNPGLTVQFADNGAVAVRQIKRSVPDVVVTDLMMPEADGLTLCRELKSGDLTNHIPVILLTAKGRDIEREKGLALGADTYITKPFSTREVLELIRQYQETKDA